MPRPLKVLFVCLHGSAKSVIAAEHFGRLARAAGRNVDAGSAGLEPDQTIPPHVVSGLAGDGFDVTGRTPSCLTDGDIAGADVIVSLGCGVDTGSSPATLMRWDDIPAVSDGYAPARNAIVGRLRTFLADMLEADPSAGCD